MRPIYSSGPLEADSPNESQGGRGQECLASTGNGYPEVEARRGFECLEDLELHTARLELIADWKDTLSARLRRAELCLEFGALTDQDLEALTAEVSDFKHVCRCIAGSLKGPT